MELLTPNTVDASEEKHLPVMTDLGGGKIKVEVGSVAHPMLPEHHISFIIVETTDGFLYKPFIETTKGSPAEKAEALFNIGNDDKIVALYEYCNIHGLWKSDIKN
jgi:superoxide reductase